MAFIASNVLGQTGDPSKLISLKKCAMCHKKDDKGNQFGKWQSMGHAKAYEDLIKEKAKKRQEEKDAKKKK